MAIEQARVLDQQNDFMEDFAEAIVGRDHEEIVVREVLGRIGDRGQPVTAIASTLMRLSSPATVRWLFSQDYDERVVVSLRMDAQREASEAFIQSQRHEGWITLSKGYDDGGFTGANLDRPALQQLLADVAAGEVDCVVIYKLDRLTRSMRDFFKIIEVLEKHSVTFVSVTQQFNTKTSLGRLALNILLSFAEFERETISERIQSAKPPFAALQVSTPGQTSGENGPL